jgi:NAD(P)-dependent dehydrogenase (short-subunit alcohol dehydrogenase family)
MTIASKGLLAKPFLKVDLKDPEFRDGKFSVEKAYYQSKIAQLMYTYWLAEQLKETRATANCIRVPSVRVDISKYSNVSRVLRVLYSLKMKTALSPEEMGKTYTYLATSDDVSSLTGKYFDERHRVVTSSKYSADPENIAQVMKRTMDFVCQRRKRT